MNRAQRGADPQRRWRPGTAASRASGPRWLLWTGVGAVAVAGVVALAAARTGTPPTGLPASLQIGTGASPASTAAAPPTTTPVSRSTSGEITVVTPQQPVTDDDGRTGDSVSGDSTDAVVHSPPEVGDAPASGSTAVDR